MTKPILADGVPYTPDMDIYIAGYKKEAEYIASTYEVRYFEQSIEEIDRRTFALSGGWYFVRPGDSALMGEPVNKFYSTLEASLVARNAAKKQELARQIAKLQMELESL